MVKKARHLEELAGLKKVHDQERNFLGVKDRDKRLRMETIDPYRR